MPAADAPPPRTSQDGCRPAREAPDPPGAPLLLTLAPQHARGDIPGLCERVRGALHDGPPDRLVLCDVAAVAEPDLVTVETLARLQLTARRHGHRLGLRNAGPRLRALLELTGLTEVLPLGAGSLLGDRGAVGADPRGQAEQREEMRGVEEGVEPGDAAVRYLDDL